MTEAGGLPMVERNPTKEEEMLNPSRTRVVIVGLIALVALALGLATDVGLFGWTFALLLALYLGAVAVARVADGGS